MALTEFQRGVCRLLAENRVRSGESYVAGGAALNELLRAPRRSRDLDLFHDTEQALATSWTADRGALEREGYVVSVVRERPTFVEAEVLRGGEAVIVQWAHDSAHRFFPLVRHDELGLVLHPFDLATSKVLALVGRVEPRDFVDTLTCDREVQPFGLLAWAACGKDPGFSPAAILEHAARSARYSAAELAGLEFDGVAPDAGELSRRWHAALDAAREVVALLPAREAGRAVMLKDGGLFRQDTAALREAVHEGRLAYHEGSIGGAFPRVLPSR
jgi:hypothetical protein